MAKTGKAELSGVYRIGKTRKQAAIEQPSKGGIVKRFILIVVLIAASTGCTRQWRTGTVCVEQFSTTGFKTSNPIDVKQDVVDSLRDQIPAGFKPYIESRTSLKVVDDCNSANYTISGRVSTVETLISNYGINILTGGSTSSGRTFGIGVQGVIKDNKTSEVISEFNDFQHYSSLELTLYHLSSVVIDGAKYYYPTKSK